MESAQDKDNELLEKIIVCVMYDLLGYRNLVKPDNMSVTEKIKFTKQTNRLYDACMIMPDAYNYINERYSDINSRKHKIK